MNETTFRIMLTSKGFPEPAVIEREANLATTDHVHDFSVCALILDGKISVVTADGTTTCGPGDTFTLNSGVIHHEEYGSDGARILSSKRVP